MDHIARRKTRQVRFGDVAVGGDSPISIQSMSTLPACAVEELLGEIGSLYSAGCEIVRVSVRDEADADALKEVCGRSPIPVVADIHFDHRLAVISASRGAAGLRINPGNIGGEKKVRAVIEAAAKAGIPVRVGVNSGSLEKRFRELYSKDPARALFESAVSHMEMIERMGFDKLIFSLKSSSPSVTVEANRLFAAAGDYPIHAGVTEAGPPLTGTARSAVALTVLLLDGIGDTIRVSLSGDPVNEVIVAAAILSSLGLRPDLPVLISCPTCGRSHIDVAGLSERMERILPSLRSGITVAVMGCEVNGPGEATEADVGLAGTKNGAVLFKKGRVVRKLEGNLLEALIEEIDGPAGDERL